MFEYFDSDDFLYGDIDNVVKILCPFCCYIFYLSLQKHEIEISFACPNCNEEIFK